MHYDATVIVTYAERLYAQATRIIVLLAVLGLILGGVAGFAIDLAASMGAGAMLVGAGALVGAAFGAAIGAERGFRYRLEAQRALCEVQTESHLRALRAQLAPGSQPAQPAA